jgi:hypothetical protein
MIIVFLYLEHIYHSLNSPFIFRNMTIATNMTTIPGMRITKKKKFSGSLQAREATITEADTAIKANPIVVKRLAHLLWIRTKTEDNEKGTRSIPTVMTTAI